MLLEPSLLSEKSCRVALSTVYAVILCYWPAGRELSGALVATLIGLAMSNVGITSPAAPQYAIVNSYLLPLAIPLLLFSANLRDVLQDTGVSHSQQATRHSIL